MYLIVSKKYLVHCCECANSENKKDVSQVVSSGLVQRTNKLNICMTKSFISITE